ALLAKLGKNTQYVHLSNPLLSANDFITYLASSVFSKKIRFKSKAEFLIEFENFLKKCLQHQQNFILIIDEAHKLSFELLEEVRLLSNMETADEKLINIFLAGQPELNENLRQPQNRALLQRINTRYHIKPLDLQSTQEYILKSLETAGAKNNNKIFSKNVIKAIYQYSEGYPRTINILADNVLLLGYARGTRKILPEMVKECYEDLQLKGAEPKSPPPKLKVPEVRKQEHPKININRKWAPGLLFLIVVFAIAIGWNREHKFSASANTIVKERILAQENIERKIQKSVKNLPANEIKKQSFDDSESRTFNGVEAISSGKPKDIGQQQKEGEGPQETIITVKEGETLMALALSVYGQANEKILNSIQKYNPGIKDTNHITAGQDIVFPQLLASDPVPTFSVHIASVKPFENARKLFLDLLEQGHEAYLIPINNARKGKFFRISLGNFETQQAAENYTKEVRKNKVSDYARVIQLEMK
ncbi:MAG: AAA family ATPase, partial [Deltaproteobacteria bacterium]|nr:AAA family ATPase [Deltaproteobacteria bacterium]